MVPSVFIPVVAVWYLLFLHLFWHYGTFCYYTCSGTILPEQVQKQKVPYCQNRCKNRRYHNARTSVKVWYLLFLHLFWQYGTFCIYTCSGSMVPSVFTPVLAIWYLLFLHLFW
jgi:hypothetical protein